MESPPGKKKAGQPFRFAAIGTVALAVSMVGAGVAHSAPNDWGKLAELSPGVSASDLEASVARVAAAEGVSSPEALDGLLAEAEASVKAATTAEAHASSTARSGGSSTVLLGTATQTGDIFVSPASTLFVQHGHTGIFYNTRNIIEAQSPGKNSVYRTSADKRVGIGAEIQHVDRSCSVRKKVVDRAKKYYVGIKYDANFLTNKSSSSSALNCSELVWKAYKYGASIDLDATGGSGVYPYDIYVSKYTKTYRTR